ncbi:hypothetical protein CY35_06G139900 [Sphagnum magellanicum]|nr:hypothetical protein CY35_06G139900 [Sphagnum magellanicum]
MSHGEAHVGSNGVPEVQLGVVHVGSNGVPEVRLGVDHAGSNGVPEVQLGVLILKVPRYMRKYYPDQFTPIEWRLGLHNYETTSAAEDLKTSIREAFGLANEVTWNDFCDDVVDHNYYVSLLRSYGLDHPPTPFTEVEVKSSLVLDALVLILRFAQPSRDDLGGCPRHIFNPAVRSILDKPLVRLRLRAMQLDIFLVENQMPLALLKKAVKKLIHLPVTASAPVDGPSMEIAILDRVLLTAINLVWPFTGGSEQFQEYFWSTYPKETLADTLGNCAHILDCVYRVLCGPRSVSKQAPVEDIVDIRCATNLKTAGIKIKAVAGPLDNLSFQHRCLFVPAITISDMTEALFRNLAVHEDMNLEKSFCEFSSYLQLMKNLISGPEDVKLLIKCGVVVNFLGNEADVCEVWNRLSRGLWFEGQSQSIHQIAEGIDQHCNSRISSINRLKTEFYEKYCSRPWYVISFFAATLVTLGTCIQAYAAVIGSDRMAPHFPPR